MNLAHRHYTPLLVFLLLAGSAAASAGPPTEAVKETVDAVLNTLKRDLAEESKRQQVYDLIAAKFDFRIMAKRILATNWRKASDAQRQRFIDLFTQLLTRTYWRRIRNYSDEQVDYSGERIKKGRYARVDTAIVTRDKRIPITYRMLKIGGQWKAYDVIIEGVSLVQNFRTSYQSIVKREGMDGLLAKMAAKLEARERKGA